MPKGSGKVLSQNKKANHDYFIEETYETGIVLQGTEIKSIRAGRVNLKDSFAKIERGEVFLHNMHVSPYEQGNRYNHDPLRTRKLLMHRKEINKLIGLTKEKRLFSRSAKAVFEKRLCQSASRPWKREEEL